MTHQEQNIIDDKMRADIALALEQAGLAIEQAAKTRADTGHVKIQTILAPFLAAAAVIGATAAVVKLFF